jgi:hypothetical protein
MTKRGQSHERLKHCAFSHNEDLILTQMVAQLGEDNWQELTRSLSKRSARQCRERWAVLTKRAESRREWTADEDTLLVSKCMQLGPKWRIIEVFFTGRDVPSLKARWRLLTKRAEMESLTVKDDASEPAKDMGYVDMWEPGRVDRDYGISMFDKDDEVWGEFCWQSDLPGILSNPN